MPLAILLQARNGQVTTAPCSQTVPWPRGLVQEQGLEALSSPKPLNPPVFMAHIPGGSGGASWGTGLSLEQTFPDRAAAALTTALIATFKNPGCERSDTEGTSVLNQEPSSMAPEP